MPQRIISFADAIREGLTEAAQRDPAVIFFAEGVTDPTAVFGTLKGIDKAIGAERMIEMPISENALTGVAIGAGLAGRRPVISFHRVEFALLAMEQIVNNAAKMHYASNGHHKVPLVIRLIVGRGWGQGPAHSQSLESVFGHFPGLKVVTPTFPQDAKGLIMGAVQDDNPVVVLEQRWCHYVTGHVEEKGSPLPLDGPKVVNDGADVTIVASSYMTLEACLAAECLAAAGIGVEVIDLRVVRPLNIEPILKSVQKTGRLITVDSGWSTFGIGAEIISQVVQASIGLLRTEPRRLGLADHPTPSSRGLIPGFYPDAPKILSAVAEVLKVPEASLQAARTMMNAAMGNRKIDMPHPAFKGPF